MKFQHIGLLAIAAVCFAATLPAQAQDLWGYTSMVLRADTAGLAEEQAMAAADSAAAAGEQYDATDDSDDSYYTYNALGTGYVPDFWWIPNYAYVYDGLGGTNGYGWNGDGRAYGGPVFDLGSASSGATLGKARTFGATRATTRSTGRIVQTPHASA